MTIVHGRELSTDELIAEVANSLIENPEGVLVYPEGVDGDELDLYLGVALLAKNGQIGGGRHAAFPSMEDIGAVPDGAVLYTLSTTDQFARD